MTFSFNLIDQPWIPCVTVDNTLVEVGLRDLLYRAHHLREVACETPVMTASVMPVVLALLHRVFGPANKKVWKALWQEGAFPHEPLDAYFTKWHDRFDLFHQERPFYQARDERVQPKSVIHLIHSIGNTGTLFTHANDQEGIRLDAGEAARHLLAAQAFRTAGLSGLEEKFTDSALTRGVLFWAYSRTVFETLVLNLLPYSGSQIPIPYTASDAPVWEQDEPFKLRQHPQGYLDYLTWPSNRIQLFPVDADGQTVVERMTIAPGLTLSPDVVGPQKRYSRASDEDDWKFLYFNADKALWRSYHSLLALDDVHVKPPAIVDWLAELALDGIIGPQYPVQLTAIGMLADQAKPIFYRQEQMPLPPALLDNETAIPTISQAITDAENVANTLRVAVNSLADCVLKRGGDRQPDPDDRKNLVKQWNVLPLYWTNLEPLFWDFVHKLSSDVPEASDAWRETLTSNAFAALAEAARCSGSSAPALKGQVIAERTLQSKIRKVFPNRSQP